MAKNIITPAFLSDNAPLHPEDSYNYKCLGILMFVFFGLYWYDTKRWRNKKPNLTHSMQNFD